MVSSPVRQGQGHFSPCESFGLGEVAQVVFFIHSVTHLPAVCGVLGSKKSSSLLTSQRSMVAEWNAAVALLPSMISRQGRSCSSRRECRQTDRQTGRQAGRQAEEMEMDR